MTTILPTPTPTISKSREQLIVALVAHLSDDAIETVTLDVDVMAWMLVCLPEEQLNIFARHIIRSL